MDTKVVAKFNKTQAEIAKVEQKIMDATSDLQVKLKTLREQDAEVRVLIKAAMEKRNVKKFENDLMVITYVAPSIRKSLDSAKLKADAPGIYDKYVKDVPVASSIRIKVKGE